MPEPQPPQPTSTQTKKARQGRSPAFPFISVEKALERAETFRVAEGGRPKHFSPLSSAFSAWEMGARTSSALQTVAALNHYGLFEFEGTGDKRSARLTPDALSILLDKQPESPERDALVKKAALAPTIHNELWEKWGADLPSDPTLITYLVRDRGFSEVGAQSLIAQYKATIKFAKLTQSDTIPQENSANPGKKPDAFKKEVKVGDYVQWSPRGSDQFKPLRKVEWISDDGTHLRVSGSQTGIPVAEVTVGPAPPEDPTPPPRNVGVKIMEGERELVTGPLSGDARFRLVVSGHVGSKEIGRLIRKLEMEKEIVEEAEAEVAANFIGEESRG